MRILVWSCLSLLSLLHPGVSATSSGKTLSISGRIYGLQGNDHVLVRALGASGSYRTTTRASGWWSIERLEPGEFLIQPIHARYRFKPEKCRVFLGKHSLSGLKFQAEPRNEENMKSRVRISAALPAKLRIHEKDPVDSAPLVGMILPPVADVERFGVGIRGCEALRKSIPGRRIR